MTERFNRSPEKRELVGALAEGRLSRREFLQMAKSAAGTSTALALLLNHDRGSLAATRGAGARARVRFGMMTTISGAGSILAPPTINAARLAVNEINASGGVLGREVELLIEDNHTDVDIAVQKGLKLVLENKVAAFLDFGFSNSRFAVAEQVSLRHRVIMLSPIYYEGGICHRYFFNISALPNQGIDPFVPWLMKGRQARTFYGIGSAYAWGIGSIDAVERAVAANGGTFLGREEAPLGTTDWSAIIQRLASKRPDVCFVFVAGNDMITFLKQFFDFGLYGKVQLASTYFQEEVTPAIPEQYRAGHLSANTWFLTYDSPESKKFLASYYRLAGKDALVTNFGEATYDAIWMWAEAVEKAGTFETEAVVEALKGLKFRGPQGEIVIDPQTHHASVRCLIGETTVDPRRIKIVADLGMIPPKPPKACVADAVR